MERLGAPYPTHYLDYCGDLRGLSVLGAMRHMHLLQKLSNEAERAFPESAGSLVLVNCPAGAATLWSIVKQFLDPVVVEKVRIVSGPGTDVILDVFGEDAVPVEYGGKNPVTIRCPPLRADEVPKLLAEYRAEEWD